MEVEVEEAYTIYQKNPRFADAGLGIVQPKASSHPCTNMDIAISPQRYSYNLLASGRFSFGKADQPVRSAHRLLVRRRAWSAIVKSAPVIGHEVGLHYQGRTGSLMSPRSIAKADLWLGGPRARRLLRGSGASTCYIYIDNSDRETDTSRCLYRFSIP